MEDTILSTFKSFINDILMVNNINNYEEISKYYKDILNMESIILKDNEIINNFITNINKYSDLIISEDLSIFDNELLPHINFKEIISNNSDEILIKNFGNIYKRLILFLLI